MKKTIIIIILAIYIASIAIVNFFGLEIKVFDGITYVTDIQCESITVQNENPITIESLYSIGGKKLFEFDFIPAPEDAPYTDDDESIIKNPNAVQINYEVFPHLADDTSVKFEFDKTANEGVVVFHELSRTFVFLKPNRMVDITIRATDGSNVSIHIKLIANSPSI